MSTTSEFLVDLERGELCALERFLERSGSSLAAGLRETSSVILQGALQAMHTSVHSVIQHLDHDDSVNQVSVAMQLLEEQAEAAAQAFRRLTVSELDMMLEDEEVSNDASLALWKILDVIGPIEVRL